MFIISIIYTYPAHIVAFTEEKREWNEAETKRSAERIIVLGLRIECGEHNSSMKSRQVARG
jgi:hypothetical protein